MSKQVFVNSEITPDHVWINISKGKTVCAAVLVNMFSGRINIHRGVYKLEDKSISTVKEMIRYAEEGENIRFYILECADVDTSEEG